MAGYFEVVPRSFDAKRQSGVERAVNFAEYCGKYDCFEPTDVAGVSVHWCLTYGGKYYEVSKDGELVFKCCDKCNIERYLRENISVLS